MNVYEYQRSRSFIDLGPRSLRSARLIETKFHVEPPWDGRMKVCSNGPGHMTSMAACPCIVKTFKKSSSLEPNS